MFTHLPDTVAQARLHDLAKAEAVRLRGEAIHHFGGQALAERSAARLNARLARHRRERSASTPSPKPTMQSGA